MRKTRGCTAGMYGLPDSRLMLSLSLSLSGSPSSVQSPARRPMARLGRAGRSSGEAALEQASRPRSFSSTTYVNVVVAQAVASNKTTQHTQLTMRSFFLGLFLALLSFVSALSAAGSKLLVVVDDEADKGKYSTFWSDLQCKSFTAIPPYPMHRTLN